MRVVDSYTAALAPTVSANANALVYVQIQLLGFIRAAERATTVGEATSAAEFCKVHSWRENQSTLKLGHFTGTNTGTSPGIKFEPQGSAGSEG